MYPKKTIKELLATPEGGYFVVYGRIAGFVRVDQWFYTVCDCNNFMGNEFGFYLCDVCHRTSFNVTPKYVAWGIVLLLLYFVSCFELFNLDACVVFVVVGLGLKYLSMMKVVLLCFRYWTIFFLEYLL
jgi:hypothetical protein